MKLEIISSKIASAITLSGLTQTQIARAIGVSQQTISHYVKGDKLPALDTFSDLCALLDLDANDILCLNDK